MKKILERKVALCEAHHASARTLFIFAVMEGRLDLSLEKEAESLALDMLNDALIEFEECE